MKYVSDGRSGDTARCLNGHGLYRLCASVTAGSIIQTSDVQPLGDAPKPVDGQPIKPCHICGLPWIIVNPDGGYVFCDMQRKFEV